MLHNMREHPQDGSQPQQPVAFDKQPSATKGDEKWAHGRLVPPVHKTLLVESTGPFVMLIRKWQGMGTAAANNHATWPRRCSMLATKLACVVAPHLVRSSSLSPSWCRTDTSSTLRNRTMSMF